MTQYIFVWSSEMTDLVRKYVLHCDFINDKHVSLTFSSNITLLPILLI